MDDVAQKNEMAGSAGPRRPDSKGEDRPMPKVGDMVQWETLGGGKFVGRVLEMDSNIAIVELPDGSRRAVEC